MANILSEPGEHAYQVLSKLILFKNCCLINLLKGKKSKMNLKAFVLDFPLVGNIYTRFSIKTKLSPSRSNTQF